MPAAQDMTPPRGVLVDGTSVIEQRVGDVLRMFRDAPFVSQEQILPGRFLVLAPHADDETLGCGGLIAEACSCLLPPVVAILTDGGMSHPGSRMFPRDRLIATRMQEATYATALLGLPRENLHFLGAPDGAVPTAGETADRLVQRLCALATGCDSILVTWRHDPHCDHEAACRLAGRVAEGLSLRLFEYPVWGWTLDRDTTLPDGPCAAWRVGVARHLPAKRRAVLAHASQHAGLITDDPAGFVLPPNFLALFDQPWETLVETRP